MKRIKNILEKSHQDDCGNNTVLVVGYVVIVLFLVVVVFYVTQFNIAARQLISTADSAANAAVMVAIQSGNDADTEFNIDEKSISESVISYLEKSQSYQHHESLSVRSVRVDSTAQTATVILDATAHPPLSHVLLPQGVPISAEASARLILTR